MRIAFVAASCFVLFGCPTPVPDGGSPPDDAGPGDVDGGPGTTDGGPGTTDGGPGSTDGGPGTSDGGPGSIDGGPVDGGPEPGPSRAVVVSLNRTGGDNDGVIVLSLTPDGALIDLGAEFGGFVNPRYVAMSPGGQEALVAFGFIGGDYGVARLSFNPDGTNAALEEVVTLGSGEAVFGLTFASDTLALLALASNPQHEMVALVRDAPFEPFAAGAYSDIEGNWPLHAISDDEGGAFLLRGNLLDEDSTEIFALEHDAVGGWTRQGDPAVVTPSSLHIEAGNGVVYSPTRDPNDPVTVDDLEGAGQLFVFDTAGGAFAQATVFPLPRSGTELVLAPDLSELVVNGVFYDVSGGNPRARGSRWMTVALDDSGQPTDVVLGASELPALLIHDLELTPEGNLVVARQLYPDQAASTAEEIPLTIHRRQGDDWIAVGFPVYLDGQPDLGVAP